MRFTTAITSLAIVCGISGVIGCAKSPPMFEGRHALNRSMARSILDDQIANSIVSEQTIYPHHFVADSARLNPIGVQHVGVLSHHYRTNLDPNLNAEESARSIGVNFEYDQDALGEEAKASLTAAADTLNASPDAGILVTGRADMRGSNAYNLDLGKRRAARVQEYLVAQGVAADRIRIASRGELDASASSNDEAGMARDRNARFEIVGMTFGAAADLNVRQGEASDQLYNARIKTVVRAMEKAGVKLNLVTIRDGFAGGEGMIAERVVIILNSDKGLSKSGSKGQRRSTSGSVSGSGMRQTASKSLSGK